MIRKWLAIGIILLFVGVTIAPTITFQVVKASRQNEIKGRITTVGYQLVQHRQIPLFTSVLTSLKESKGVPSCYFSVVLLFLLLLYFTKDNWEDMTLINWFWLIFYIITWPISIPLLAVFIIAIFLSIG
jgi:multisubunit Na+/H+ antiporter MnhG subunit